MRTLCGAKFASRVSAPDVAAAGFSAPTRPSRALCGSWEPRLGDALAATRRCYRLALHRLLNSVQYRPDIDGLRALAVLPVVIFHVNPHLMSGGFLGVDVFFVISGYLISLLLYQALATGRMSLASFYGRRMRRLFPALIVVLLATLSFGYFALLAGEYVKVAKQAAAAIFFLLNFRLIGETGYFDVASFSKPLMHLWSLSVEEQFYLVWPLVLLLLFRLRSSTLVTISIGILLSMGFAAWRGTINLDTVYYHPLARFWELLVGAMIARLHFKADPDQLPGMFLPPWVGHGLSVVGLLLVASALLWFDSSIPHPGVATLWPVIGVALILACGPQAFANRLLAWRPLVLVGLMSYPLYLWHWPMLSYVRIMESGRPDPLTLWVTAALSMALAWLTYVWLERPVRRAGGLLGINLALLASMALLAILSFAIVKGVGWPGRPSLQYTKAFEPELVRSPAQDESCLARFAGGPAPVYCRQYLPGKRMIAIIGDSHAHVLFPGVSELAAKDGYGTLLLANSGCPPFVGTTWGRTNVSRQECVQSIDLILRNVLADARVVSVVIASRGPIYISGKGYGPVEAQYNVPPIASATQSSDALAAGAADVFGRGLLETAMQFDRRRIRVSYVLQVPELGVSAKDCPGRPLSLTSRFSQCDVPYDDYLKRMGHYRAHLLDLTAKAPFLHLVDLEPEFCVGGFCSSMRKGQLLYADDNHLSFSGSRLVAPLILKQALAGLDRH